MTRRTTSLILAAGLLGLLAAAPACKKTVKGETSRWDTSNRKLDDLGVLYPAFKTALEDHRVQAKALFDSAQTLDGDEAKAKKMAQANAQLMGGFVEQLAEVDTTIKSVRSKLVEAGAVAADAPEKPRAESVAAEANRTLAEVDRRLRAGAKDAAGARAIMDKVTSDLQHADRLLGEIMPKAEPAAGTAAGTPAPVGDTPPTTWTCEFCDHQNEAEANPCVNCGAARPAPK